MKRLFVLLVMLLFSAFAIAAVNINTATKEELDALPGIGPVKAQAIIDYRNANGPFKSVEDIMKVKGIKEGEFGKLKGQISVSGASIAPAAKGEAKAPAAASPSAPAAKKAETTEPMKAKDKKAETTEAMKAKDKNADADRAAQEEKKSKKSPKDKAAKSSSDTAEQDKSGKSSKDKSAASKDKDDKTRK